MGSDRKDDKHDGDASFFPIGNTDPSKRGRSKWEKDPPPAKKDPKHPHRKP